VREAEPEAVGGDAEQAIIQDLGADRIVSDRTQEVAPIQQQDDSEHQDDVDACDLPHDRVGFVGNRPGGKPDADADCQRQGDEKQERSGYRPGVCGQLRHQNRNHDRQDDQCADRCQKQIGGNVVQVRSRLLREQRHERRTRCQTEKDEAERIRPGERQSLRQQHRQRGADGKIPHHRCSDEADIEERVSRPFQIELEAYFQQTAGHEDRDCNAEQFFEHVRHVLPFCSIHL